MQQRIDRRQMLGWAAGAAGLCGGVWSRAFGAQGVPASRPDQSDQAPSLPVAVQRCESYEPQLVRRQLDAALRLLGGISDLVRNKTVTVKLNLTGPVQDMLGRRAWETYHIHPHVVAALCAILSDAGARRIVLVECFYYREPFEKVLGEAGWDIAAIHSAGAHRVTFQNTRNLGPFKTYSRLRVPWGGLLFPAFDVNQHYEKTDVFISLAKLKDHGSAGVTMAVKNLFGILPCSLYGDDAPSEDAIRARVANLHMGRKSVPDGVPKELPVAGPPTLQPWQYRVPRVTADVLGARPVDLAVVDGIFTIRGGEGPWIKAAEVVEPKLLVVGRNAVCTDAVCTALMGYDPQADHMHFPFQGENHLKLLASLGVGAIDPARIEVRGLSIRDALFPFRTQQPAKTGPHPPLPWQRDVHQAYIWPQACQLQPAS